MTGYVKAHRSRFDHHLFRGEKFCRGYAWDWMIAKACYRPQRYTIKGKTIEVQRGQFVASPDEMAKAWGWSRSAVIRFLTRLQTEQMIGQDTGHKKSLITICNYEEYQSSEPQGGQKSEQEAGHKADRKRTAKEEGKEGKKEEEDTEANASDALPATPHIDDTAEAVHAYNEAAGGNGWPKVQKLTPARRKALKARLHEAGGIDGWRFAMGKASESDFLSGRSPGDRSWRPNFDFFTKQASFTKLMEGSYDNRDHQPGQHRNTGRRSPHDAHMAGFAAAACGDGRGGF